MAATMYQRGLEMSQQGQGDSPTHRDLKQGLSLVEKKRQLAQHWITKGDGFFTQKKYRQALTEYHRASQLYPDWLTPYLRQGDTYARTKQKQQAATAFKQAIQLNPDLLLSKGFAKRYKKLQKH